MTTNDDTESSGVGGQERPQVTLDLKATEVKPDTPQAGGEAAARAEHPAAERPAVDDDVSARAGGSRDGAIVRQSHAQRFGQGVHS